jgi:hypothetical protein
MAGQHRKLVGGRGQAVAVSHLGHRFLVPDVAAHHFERGTSNRRAVAVSHLGHRFLVPDVAAHHFERGTSNRRHKP